MLKISLDIQSSKAEIGRWLPKLAQFDLNLLEGTKEFTLSLQAMNEILYDYYPYLCYIYINNSLTAIAEFTREWEEVAIRLRCPDNGPHLTIDLVTELGAIPAKRNAGADERELAIYVRQIEQHEEAVLPEIRTPARAHAGIPVGPIGGGDKSPIFVIGSYRSGTSISTWSLGQHPNIAPMEETNWLPMLYYGARAAQFIAAQKPHDSSVDIYDLSEREFLKWGGESVDQLHSQVLKYHMQRIDLERHSNKGRYDKRFQVARSRFAFKRRWVDGTPENTAISLGLARMFPNAQFILMLRRPEKVIRSLMLFDRAGGERREFAEAARLWETLTVYGYEALQRLGPDRAMLSVYETLLDHPQAMLDQWFAFLGEPRFPKAAETFGQKINSSGTEPIDFDPEAKREIERLDQIYEGVIDGVPIEELPLRINFDKFEARENEILVRLVSCLTEPGGEHGPKVAN